MEENSVRKRIGTRLIPFMTLAVMAVILLSSCGKPKETSYLYHEEPVYISVGESAQLELENAPEGKTAADYSWSITGQSAEVSAGVVTGVKTFPGALAGQETVHAEMTLGNIKYMEVFVVVVEKTVDKIELQYPSLTLLVGDELLVRYTTDPETLSKGQRIALSLTEESLAELTHSVRVNGVPIRTDRITALAVGDAVLTVQTGGAEASCDVYVFERPEGADEKLRYLNSWQDSYAGEGELIEAIGRDRDQKPGVEILFSEIPEMTGSEGSGKYMVVWEWQGGNATENTYSWAASNGDGVCNYTAALPKDKRPDRWDEVEYIIRVKEGEPIQTGTYERGIRAMTRVVDITLEKPDGEVIELLKQKQGKLPNEIYLDTKNNPNAEAFYGSLPEIKHVRAMLSEIINTLDETP